MNDTQHKHSKSLQAGQDNQKSSRHWANLRLASQATSAFQDARKTRPAALDLQETFRAELLVILDPLRESASDLVNSPASTRHANGRLTSLGNLLQNYRQLDVLVEQRSLLNELAKPFARDITAVQFDQLLALHLFKLVTGYAPLTATELLSRWSWLLNCAGNVHPAVQVELQSFTAKYVVAEQAQLVTNSSSAFHLLHPLLLECQTYESRLSASILGLDRQLLQQLLQGRLIAAAKDAIPALHVSSLARIMQASSPALRYLAVTLLEDAWISLPALLSQRDKERLLVEVCLAASTLLQDFASDYKNSTLILVNATDNETLRCFLVNLLLREWSPRCLSKTLSAESVQALLLLALKLRPTNKESVDGYMRSCVTSFDNGKDALLRLSEQNALDTQSWEEITNLLEVFPPHLVALVARKAIPALLSRDLNGQESLFQDRPLARRTLFALADLAPTTFYKVLFRLTACKKMTDDDLLPALRQLHSLTCFFGPIDFFFRSPDSAEMILVLLFVKGSDEIASDSNGQQWRERVLGKEILLLAIIEAVRARPAQADHTEITIFLQAMAPSLFALLKSKEEEAWYPLSFRSLLAEFLEELSICSQVTRRPAYLGHVFNWLRQDKVDSPNFIVIQAELKQVYWSAGQKSVPVIISTYPESMFRLLTSLFCFLRDEEWAFLLDHLWQSGMQNQLFLFCQACERHDAQALEIFRSGLSSPSTQTRLGTIKRLAQILGARFDLLPARTVIGTRKLYKAPRFTNATIPTTIGSTNPKPITRLITSGALSLDVKAGLEAIGWDKEKSNTSASERQQIPFSALPSLDIVNWSSPGRLARQGSSASMQDRKSILVNVVLEAIFASASFCLYAAPEVAASSKELISHLLKAEPSRVVRYMNQQFASTDKEKREKALQLCYHLFQTDRFAPPVIVYDLYNMIAGLCKTITRDQFAEVASTRLSELVPLVAHLSGLLADISVRDVRKNKVESLLFDRGLQHKTTDPFCDSLDLETVAVRVAQNRNTSACVLFQYTQEDVNYVANSIEPFDATSSGDQASDLHLAWSWLCLVKNVVCQLNAYYSDSNKWQRISKDIDVILIRHGQHDRSVVQLACSIAAVAAGKFHRLFGTGSSGWVIVQPLVKCFCISSEPAIHRSIKETWQGFFRDHQTSFLVRALSHIVLSEIKEFANRLFELLSSLSQSSGDGTVFPIENSFRILLTLIASNASTNISSSLHFLGLLHLLAPQFQNCLPENNLLSDSIEALAKVYEKVHRESQQADQFLGLFFELVATYLEATVTLSAVGASRLFRLIDECEHRVQASSLETLLSSLSVCLLLKDDYSLATKARFLEVASKITLSIEAPLFLHSLAGYNAQNDVIGTLQGECAISAIRLCVRSNVSISHQIATATLSASIASRLPSILPCIFETHSSAPKWLVLCCLSLADRLIGDSCDTTREGSAWFTMASLFGNHLSKLHVCDQRTPQVVLGLKIVIVGCSSQANCPASLWPFLATSIRRLLSITSVSSIALHESPTISRSNSLNSQIDPLMNAKVRIDRYVTWSLLEFLAHYPSSLSLHVQNDVFNTAQKLLGSARVSGSNLLSRRGSRKRVPSALPDKAANRISAFLPPKRSYTLLKVRPDSIGTQSDSTLSIQHLGLTSQNSAQEDFVAVESRTDRFLEGEELADITTRRIKSVRVALGMDAGEGMETPERWSKEVALRNSREEYTLLSA